MSLRPEKTKSQIKITPLKGQVFDIKPPENYSAPQQKRTGGDFLRFFVLSFVVVFVLNIANIFLQAQGISSDSRRSAMAGYDYLQNGIHSLKNKDHKAARVWFKDAENAFNELESTTHYLTAQANVLTDESLYLGTAEKMIDSGIVVARLGQELSQLVENALQIPQVFVENYSTDKDTNLMDLIYVEKNRLDRVYAEVIVLQNNISTLNKDLLPSDIQKQVQKGRDEIENLLVALGEIKNNFDSALKLLGDKMPHRYLVLLQNNHELRATGGFIGSYLLIDVNDGKITRMEAKDIYESDGQLSEQILPPAGIDKVSEYYHMRDANYSPDFSESAEKIMWFLEHSRGPSVDTVIAIDQSVIEKFLELTGSVRLEHLPLQIRADNFNTIFSYFIESKLNKGVTPKQILFDFIPVFKDKLFDINGLVGVLDVLNTAAKSRHIQAYSTDLDIQSLIERLSVDGKMLKPALKTDYLNVVTTSIGGNKSDEFIHTQINHQTEVADSGLLIDNLSITKAHTWTEEAFVNLNYLISRYGTGKASLKTLRFILGEGRNLDYMRIYVPKGSRLISATGVDIDDIEISEDLGYSVFGFVYTPVLAGDSETVQLQYELPYHLVFQSADTYRFVAQKQAGAENVTFKKDLVVSDFLKIEKSFPKTNDPFSLTPAIESTFDENQIFLSVISRGVK